MKLFQKFHGWKSLKTEKENYKNPEILIDWKQDCKGLHCPVTSG